MLGVIFIRNYYSYEVMELIFVGLRFARLQRTSRARAPPAPSASEDSRARHSMSVI